MTLADSTESIRVDRWLWHARIFKTRSQSAAQVSAGRIRVSGKLIKKPAYRVGPGAILTVTVGRRVRVLEVVAPGQRRGPPAEAQQLYREVFPEPS